MAVSEIHVSLHFMRANRATVLADELHSALVALDRPPVADVVAPGTAYASAYVAFTPLLRARLDAEHLEDAEATKLLFLQITSFLREQSEASLERLRMIGMSIRLFISIRMDQDQMELDLSPDLLAQLGRLGLGLFVISNDISAAERIEEGWR